MHHVPIHACIELHAPRAAEHIQNDIAVHLLIFMRERLLVLRLLGDELDHLEQTHAKIESKCGDSEVHAVTALFHFLSTISPELRSYIYIYMYYI